MFITFYRLIFLNKNEFYQIILSKNKFYQKSKLSYSQKDHFWKLFLEINKEEKVLINVKLRDFMDFSTFL